MKKKYLIAGALLSLSAVLLTACGSTKINLNDYVVVTYDGYETVGKARADVDVEKMISDHPEAFNLKGTPSELEKAAVEVALDGSIRGSLDKSDGLKNGDTVNWTWNNGDLTGISEKYPVTFTFENTSYTASGFKQAETFDPFEKIKVVFDGTAPNGTCRIDDSGKVLPNLKYTASAQKGLKNGDTVTVTVSAGNDLDAYCGQNGKIASAKEKEYKVEGLSAFAMKLEEVPKDTLEKIRKQGEDAITQTTTSWAEGNSLKGIELIGYYFLAAKEGFTPHPTDRVYCVYKVTAELTGVTGENDKNETVGEDSYYTYFACDDIMLLPDGTASVDLSAGELGHATAKSKYGSNGWLGFSAYTFQGYKDLDSMFSDCVTKRISQYDYENTVKE